MVFGRASSVNELINYFQVCGANPLQQPAAEKQTKPQTKSQQLRSMPKNTLV